MKAAAAPSRNSARFPVNDHAPDEATRQSPRDTSLVCSRSLVGVYRYCIVHAKMKLSLTDKAYTAIGFAVYFCCQKQEKEKVKSCPLTAIPHPPKTAAIQKRRRFVEQRKTFATRACPTRYTVSNNNPPAAP